MISIDLDTLRARIRSMDFEPGTPEQIALWREDFAESCANLAIEDMPLDAEDDAMFAMMLDEGVSPAMMVTLIHGLYQPGAHQLAACSFGERSLHLSRYRYSPEHAGDHRRRGFEKRPKSASPPGAASR